MAYASIIERVISFLNSSLIRQALLRGEFDKISEIVNHVEWIIESAFKRHNNLTDKVDRPSLLSTLLYEDIGNLTQNTLQKRINNIRIALQDILNYHIRLERNITTISGNYEIYQNFDLDFFYWRNISTGLTGGYRRFKYMIANNHLLAKIMEDPGSFTGDVERKLEVLGVILPDNKTIEVGLENGSRYVDKIDDALVALEVPNFIVKIGNKSVDLGRRFIRITYDSKFYINPERIGDTKVVKQQIMLTFQDRVKDEFIPVVKQVMESDLSVTEQGELLKELIPVMFQHYVVKPSDTSSVSQNVKDVFAEAFKSEGRAHFESVLDVEINGFSKDHGDLLQAIFQGIEKHAEDHFRSGKFISENSDLLYFDW